MDQLSLDRDLASTPCSQAMHTALLAQRKHHEQWRQFFVSASLLLAVGCEGRLMQVAPGGSAGMSSICAAGTEQCYCYSDDTCEQGLECRGGSCIASGTGGSVSTGGTSSGTGGSASTGGPSSGTTQVIACLYDNETYVPGSNVPSGDTCRTCYCSSNGQVDCVSTNCLTGAGGSSVGGGMAGTGGMTPASGGGSSTSTGSAGGSSAPTLCTGTPPTSPIVTDDAGVKSNAITGNPSLVTGNFTYAATGLTQPTVAPILASDGTLLGLQVTATPGAGSDPYNAWLGVGLALRGCVDASAYTGVRFTIAGDLGTCSLAFVAVPTEKQPVAYGGSCAEVSCWSPASAPLALGTSTVHFADLVGGGPGGPIDPSRLMTVQWQLSVPTNGSIAPCIATFSITDVAFVNY
jgi:hypothetical protein